ncbi:MAG: Txe/YoeB family addiction module toxin [Bacteroidales bacterium]|nr:Txe/YoeB family addiction module toxin [Bacteroidales bacterium]
MHPRYGTGKPEPLKGALSQYYSRRVTKKHRLIYEIKDYILIVYVLSVSGHYGDK